MNTLKPSSTLQKCPHPHPSICNSIIFSTNGICHILSNTFLYHAFKDHTTSKHIRYFVQNEWRRYCVRPPAYGGRR